MMDKEKKNYVEEMKKNFLLMICYDCSIPRLNVNELDELRKQLEKKESFLKLQKIELLKLL